MKYCLRYSNQSKRLKEADEISIIYNRQDTALPAFLEEWKDKKVILVVNNVKEFEIHQEWKKLNAIHDKYPEYDFEVCFNHKEVPAIVLIDDIAANLQIPWFVQLPITNWDALHYFVDGGVSQVYVAEELGFDLEAVAAYCHSHNVKIRIFPNVAQASIKGADPLKKFFVRPDDIEFYGQYVDVCEFWCEYDQQDIYFKIYKGGKWLGPLKDIIKDFDHDIDNKHIVPIFGPTRVKCGKRCLKGRPCAICEKIYDVSLALKNSNFIIQSKKNRGV